MPRTGENIYKRKDGRWEGRYIKERIDGKARYAAVYARSYREVKRKLEEAKEEVKKKENPPEKAGKMADIARLWLSEAARDLKVSTVNKYEDLLRCYILPEFGEKDLSEITNQCIIDFVSRLLSTGGSRNQGLKSATVAEILSAMNSIRVYAMKRDHAVAFSPECIRLKQERKEIHIFTLQEEKRLLAHIEENMDLPAMGILLCLFTGIRVGELCALTWDDISLSERTMVVRKTMQRIRVKGAEHKTAVKILEPKSTNSVRTIPLPDVMMELLEQHHVPGAFLLTGDAQRYIEPRTMQNRFKKMLAACGLPEVNFHATRHTFATRCIELDFDAKSLSEILGHSNVSITMNRYVHPSMAHKTEHMNRFSNLFTVSKMVTEGRKEV